MKRLAVLDDWEGLIENSKRLERLESKVEIRYFKEAINFFDEENEQTQWLLSCHFLLAIRERTKLPKEIIQKFSNLELILQTGGHAYHIDTQEAHQRGIIIALGRHAKTALNSVPELTFAFAINLLRNIPQLTKKMSTPEGEWPSGIGNTLSGKRLGILGLGRHGMKVATIAQAFGMHVIALQRSPSSEGGSNSNNSNSNNSHSNSNAILGIERLELKELLQTSDIVSIHLRLSEESKGLISKEAISWMKPSAFLINTARGQIIDESALIDALREGRIAGAGLDVFETEPLPSDSPLRSFPNVVLTPHIGWTVSELFDEFALIAAVQLEEYLTSFSLPSSQLINPSTFEVLRSRLGHEAPHHC